MIRTCEMVEMSQQEFSLRFPIFSLRGWDSSLAFLKESSREVSRSTRELHLLKALLDGLKVVEYDHWLGAHKQGEDVSIFVWEFVERLAQIPDINMEQWTNQGKISWTWWKLFGSEKIFLKFIKETHLKYFLTSQLIWTSIPRLWQPRQPQPAATWFILVKIFLQSLNLINARGLFEDQLNTETMRDILTSYDIHYQLH